MNGAWISTLQESIKARRKNPGKEENVRHLPSPTTLTSRTAPISSEDMSRIIILSYFFLLSLVADAKFILYEAGTMTVAVAELREEATICPTDYSNGFNIECVGTPSDSNAIFTMNEMPFSREQAKPFFMAGNNGNVIKAWKDYPDRANVVCTLPSGVQSISITISCDRDVRPSPAANRPETNIYFRALNDLDGSDDVAVMDGMSFCPRRDIGSSDFTVVCVAPGAERATFRVNGGMETVTRSIPFFISGGDEDKPNLWASHPNTPFKLSCRVSGGGKAVAENIHITCPDETMIPKPQEPKVSPTPSPIPVKPRNLGNSPKGCVVIRAKTTKLSAGWVADHADGVTFNPGNTDKGIAKPGEFPLYYQFTAPSTSRYAVVLDMTTGGRANYNDVFMELTPGGFHLIRHDISKSETGWIKGYQSMWSRGAVISSVDHHPHSMSSGAILQKGESYTFGISGRSNQVTLHNIILFECKGLECQRKHWRKDQEACLPGSTLHTPRPRKNA